MGIYFWSMSNTQYLRGVNLAVAGFTLAAVAAAVVSSYPGALVTQAQAVPPELPSIGLSDGATPDEDTSYLLQRSDFGIGFFYDGTRTVTIQSLPSRGTLYLSGTEMVIGDTFTLQQLGFTPRGGEEVPSAVRYDPDTDTCGEDSFQWTISQEQVFLDAGTQSVPALTPLNEDNFQTTTLVVDCLNDAPVAEDFAVELAQDTSWYFDMPDNASDNCFSARYSDIDATTQGSLEAWELGGLFLVTNPAHGRLFVYPDQATQYGEAGEAYEWTEGRVIARDDIESMEYIPDPGYVGTDEFDWQATDYLITESGRSINPPVEEEPRLGQVSRYQYSNVATTTLTILADTPPTVEDIQAEAEAGEPYAFSAEQFTNGYRDQEGSQVAYFRITTRPQNGTLFFGNSTEIPERLSAEDLNELRYVPNPGFSGVDRFDFVAVQDGNELESSNSGVITIVIQDTEIPAAEDSEEQTEMEDSPVVNENTPLPQGGLIRTGGYSAD